MRGEEGVATCVARQRRDRGECQRFTAQCEERVVTCSGVERERSGTSAIHQLDRTAEGAAFYLGAERRGVHLRRSA